MMFWYGSHLAFWQVTLMWVGMVAFWALIIWVVWGLMTGVTRGATRWPGSEPPAESARRILDERLAKGEIDIDEYWRLRDAMSADDHKSSAGAR